MSADELQALASEESSHTASSRGRWHAEYLGHSYRAAVGEAMARSGSGARTVLKTDLWNEAVGGARDIAAHFHEICGHHFFGLDLGHGVCVQARSRVPTLRVVRADIRALPFRTGSFDAVLDLSTLDHLPDAGVAPAIAEYRRVLRAGGVLLLVFWQRTFLMTQRLRLKRLLGRREKPDQRYFTRAHVRANLGAGLAVCGEFVTGTLLMAPHALMGLVLSRLPARALTTLLRWVADLERSRAARPLLKHLSGLYGIAALRRPTCE